MTFTGTPNQSRGVATSAHKITVGNGAVATCVGAEMQCTSITNNGTGTLVAPRTTTSTAAPSATDDSAHGFRNGDMWNRSTTAKIYCLSDATPTAAVWNILN